MSERIELSAEVSNGSSDDFKRVSVSPDQFAALVAYRMEIDQRMTIGWRYCGERSPWHWVCSRQAGHDGMHVAAMSTRRFCRNETGTSVEVWE